MRTSFQRWLCPWRVFCETVGLWGLESVWMLWGDFDKSAINIIIFSRQSVQNSEEDKGIWNSASVLLSFLSYRAANNTNPSSCLQGARVRNPAHDKVMRKEAWQNARMWSGFRGSPWNFLSMYPQNQKSAGLCILLFHSSDILWKKSNQGFSLLHLKGMFQLNPSDSSLACLTCSLDLLQLVNCLQPPNRERHKA